jgi:hypothetical protein
LIDLSYQPKTYRMDGGDRQVIASGGSLDVESGGEIDIESGGSLKLVGTAITSTAAEINLVDNMPANITFAAAAGAANISEVTCTVKDAAGATIAGVFNIDLWLSDAATGADCSQWYRYGQSRQRGHCWYLRSEKSATRADTGYRYFYLGDNGYCKDWLLYCGSTTKHGCNQSF